MRVAFHCGLALALGLGTIAATAQVSRALDPLTLPDRYTFSDPRLALGGPYWLGDTAVVYTANGRLACVSSDGTPIDIAGVRAVLLGTPRIVQASDGEVYVIQVSYCDEITSPDTLYRLVSVPDVGLTVEAVGMLPETAGIGFPTAETLGVAPDATLWVDATHGLRIITPGRTTIESPPTNQARVGESSSLFVLDSARAYLVGSNGIYFANLASTPVESRLTTNGAYRARLDGDTLTVLDRDGIARLTPDGTAVERLPFPMGLSWNRASSAVFLDRDRLLVDRGDEILIWDLRDNSTHAQDYYPADIAWLIEEMALSRSGRLALVGSTGNREFIPGTIPSPRQAFFQLMPTDTPVALLGPTLELEVALVPTQLGGQTLAGYTIALRNPTQSLVHSAAVRTYERFGTICPSEHNGATVGAIAPGERVVATPRPVPYFNNFSSAVRPGERVVTAFYITHVNGRPVAPVMQELNEIFLSSIGEVIAAPDLSIGPNPARERVVVRWDPNIARERLTVVDVLGREHAHLRATGAEAEIEVASWAPGVYYLLARTTDGTSVHAFEVSR